MNQVWIRYGSDMDQVWIWYGSGMDQVWIRYGSDMDQVWARYLGHKRFFIGFCSVLEHPGDFTLVFVTFWSFGSALGQLWISFGSASGQAWQRLILAYVFHRFGALRPAFIGFCNVSEHPDDFSLENVSADDRGQPRRQPARQPDRIQFGASGSYSLIPPLEPFQLKLLGKYLGCKTNHGFLLLFPRKMI